MALLDLIDRLRGVRPDVVVDFTFDQGLLFIELVNIGAAPACRISVSFDRPIRGVDGDKTIGEMPLFQCTEFMPPNKKISTFLDVSSAYFGRGEPTRIEIHVVFHDRRGRRHDNRIVHDLDIYRDLGYINRGGAHERSERGST